jgi:hypothetical protein
MGRVPLLVPVSWSCGHIVYLPWDLNHIRLTFMADQWPWPTLVAWVMLDNRGREPPTMKEYGLNRLRSSLTYLLAQR